MTQRQLLFMQKQTLYKWLGFHMLKVFTNECVLHVIWLSFLPQVHSHSLKAVGGSAFNCLSAGNQFKLGLLFRVTIGANLHTQGRPRQIDEELPEDVNSFGSCILAWQNICRVFLRSLQIWAKTCWAEFHSCHNYHYFILAKTNRNVTMSNNNSNQTWPSLCWYCLLFTSLNALPGFRTVCSSVTAGCLHVISCLFIPLCCWAASL